MSTVYLGSTTTLLETETVFDPRYGFQSRQTIGGPLAQLLTLSAAYTATNIRHNIVSSHGRNYLYVFFGLQDPNISETPNDYYELDTEYYEEPLWVNDKVEAEIGTLDELAGIQRDCTAALRGQRLDSSGNASGTAIEGALKPTETGFTGVKLEIYKLLLRKQETYETTRQVLSRVRTISVNYSAQVEALQIPKIYTTTSLVATFGIPTAVAARLPADPVTVPDGYAWAWKQRKNTSRYSWSGRVEEVMSWTFSAWPTNVYTLIQ